MANSTPQAKLVAVYNADRQLNGLQPIVASEFDFGVPSAYSGAKSPKNTRIYLTPKLSSTNVGRITLYYDRINLNVISTLSVEKTTQVNVVDMLPQINDELGIEFVAADVVDAVLPASTGFTLTASAANLIYTGSTSVAYAT